MIIARSIIAGLGFVLITVITVPIVICTYLSRSTTNSTVIGVDVSIVKSPKVWLPLTLVFAIGFLLRYWHLKSKMAKKSI
jgi:hypothetical protein